MTRPQTEPNFIPDGSSTGARAGGGPAASTSGGLRGWLLGAGFVVAWSSGFVGAELGGDADPATVLAWRYLATTVLVLPWLAWRRPRISARAVLRHAILGVLCQALFLGGVFFGADAGVDSGTVSVVCALQPALVLLGSMLAFGDRVGRRAQVGVAVGAIAVIIAVGGIGRFGPAVFLPVLSVVSVSTGALLERRWRLTESVSTSVAVQMVSAAVVFVVVAAVRGELAPEVDASFVGAIAWLTLLSGLAGYLLFFACLRQLGATRTSSLVFLTPPATMGWAFLMFGSIPSSNGLIGLGLGAVAVALILSRRGQRVHANPAGRGSEAEACPGVGADAPPRR